MSLRTSTLVFAFLLGLVALVGSILFAVAGAGIYGSPFVGDPYADLTLLAVLLLGPATLLPCTLLDWGRPGWGGIALCGLALAEFGALSLNHWREWGWALHDVGLGALCLSAPMFAVGTLLFFSGAAQQPRSALQRSIWSSEMAAVLAITILIGWLVGAEGADALFEWLRGGTV